MRDSGNIVKWAFAHLQNAQKTDQKRHIEHMSDAEKKASITPRQSTTLSSKVPITPRTSDAVVSGGSVKASTVASASSSKSSSTVTALMENKMSKMKEHLMKQKAKQDEQREKQFSDAMQQSGKLFM